MKIRWTDGSLRFRITPSELGALLRGEEVREALCLSSGNPVWSASLSPRPIASTRIDSAGCTVSVSLSDADLSRLAAPESEGVYFGQEGSLGFCIEKDFPCVHPRAAAAGEMAGETFAPPADFARRKENELGSE